MCLPAGREVIQKWGLDVDAFSFYKNGILKAERKFYA